MLQQGRTKASAQAEEKEQVMVYETNDGEEFLFGYRAVAGQERMSSALGLVLGRLACLSLGLKDLNQILGLVDNEV